MARIVQGIGGAMMVPVGRLVLLRSVAKSELVAAMAWLTMPALIGPVVGPPLGGFLVTYADWRWIFDINVPIGVLGMRAGHAVRRRTCASPRRAGWTRVGLVLSGLALACLMFGFETAGRGVLAAAAVRRADRGRHRRRRAATCSTRAAATAPLLDLSLLRVPTFAVACRPGRCSASASAPSRSCCR